MLTRNTAPTQNLFLRHPLSCFIASALAAGPVLADAPNPEATLPTVTVTDQAVENLPSEKSGAYTVKKTSSATKLNLSMKETPQTVSVLTRTQLNDFKLDNVNDALAATAGIVVERPETDRTYYSARGFDVTNFQHDGVGAPFVYDIVNGDIDTAIYDRVEAVYGANGLMSPTGFPSATINFLRKRPTPEFAASASLTLGSWDKKRIDADVSGALIDSRRIRGRLVIAHEDKNSYLDRYSLNKTLFYGIVEADLGEETQLTIGAHQQENKPKGTMWGALPFLHSDGTPVKYDVSDSSGAKWAGWDSTKRSAFTELTHRFNEDWSAKAVLTRQEFIDDSQLLYAYGSPDKNTGVGMFSWGSRYDAENQQTMLDLQANGRYELAGRKHDVTFGAGWAKSELEASSFDALGNHAALPFPQLLNGSYPAPVFGPYTNGAKFTDRRKHAFVANRFNLSDSFKFIAGARYASVAVDGISYGVSRQSDSRKTTPYFGAVYDLSQHFAVYGSYTEIFNPQHQQDINRATLAPVDGNSKEIGLKGEFLNKRLNGSLAYFKTEQNGLAEAAGYIGPIAYYRAIDARSKGVQFELGGNLTDRLQLNFGYTQFSLKDTDGEDVKTYIPRRILRLAGTYQLPFIEKLKVGGNLSWQDDIDRTDGGFKVRQDAYTVVNLMARYELDKQWSISANLNNVTDEKYYTSLMWSQGYYAAPRNASVSLNWKY